VRWSITSAYLQQPRGPGNHQKVVSFEQQSLLIDIWTGQDPLQAAAVPQKQASRRTMSIQKGALCQTWKPATWLKKKIATVCKIMHLADHPKKSLTNSATTNPPIEVPCTVETTRKCLHSRYSLTSFVNQETIETTV